MLQGEHSALLLTFIKLPFVIKIFVLSFFEWPFYIGLTELKYLGIKWTSIDKDLQTVSHVQHLLDFWGVKNVCVELEQTQIYPSKE